MTKSKLALLSTLFVLTACARQAGDSQPPASNANPDAAAVATAPSDQDISDAYLYLLGRVIVLRQARLDFEKEGFEWNKIIYRAPGGVAWANPNLDVAYSEAWVAVDEQNCVLLDVPEVKGGRYYTWHMLNGWGETVLNINERNFPQHPFGKFALCLKGSSAITPEGALRVDLPGKISRVLGRVELGSDPKEAVRLQHEFKLSAPAGIKIEQPVQVPLFENDKLPGADIFDNAAQIIASDPDINEGMEAVRAKLEAVEAFAKTGGDSHERIDNAIQQKAWPALKAYMQNLGMKENGWTRPKVVGNYGSDYAFRTLTNLVGLWANSNIEAMYFGIAGLDRSATYKITFPADALPAKQARYFWSIIAVDSSKFQVLPNPLKRYLLNKPSPLKYNKDGSLTLAFAPKQPKDVPQPNWLPTGGSGRFNMTFRFYGPSEAIGNGTYYPPALQEVK